MSYQEIYSPREPLNVGHFRGHTDEHRARDKEDTFSLTGLYGSPQVHSLSGARDNRTKRERERKRERKRQGDRKKTTFAVGMSSSLVCVNNGMCTSVVR